jgi:hypothetical protein
MRTVILIVAAAALALPAAAFAKGPVEASIAGPGLNGTIAVPGNGEDGGSSPLGRLVENGGFFPLAFGQQPDPTTRQAPQGDLGPRYTVTFVLPGPTGDDHLVAELYPYADPPVVHMAPGQQFFDGQRTRGGWILAADGLKPALAALGLPETAPVADEGSGFAFGLDAWIVALLAAAALVAGVAAAIHVSRRPRPARA